MKSQYEVYKENKITKDLLDSIKVGDFVKCNNWTKPLIVKAVSENYFVMVRNHFGQALYSICEKKPSSFSRNYFTAGSFRIGTDNWIFGIYDYLIKEDCERAVKDLEQGETELSVRRTIDLEFIQIKRR